MTEMSADLKEEYFSAMLHDYLTISRLMVNCQQVEETGVNRKSRDAQRERYFDGASRGRFDIKEKLKFNKRLSNEVPYKFPK